MDTPLTITVEPKHLKDNWALVYECSRETGDLVTLSIMTDEQAAQMPAETEISDYLVKKLGNVLAREAVGCFASNKAQATLTFDARTCRVKKIA